MRRLLAATTAVALIALPIGLVNSASAGSGDASAVAAAGKKKKKKTCPAGTTKKVTKNKKTGKKKTTCVPNPVPVVPPPAPTTTLSINPASVDFGPKPAQPMSGCAAFPTPDPDCPTQAFTITNSGAAASGIPSASLQIIATDPGGQDAFAIVANTCTASLAPGGTCTVTVRGAADNEFEYQSRLNVTATPGSTVSALLEIE